MTHAYHGKCPICTSNLVLPLDGKLCCSSTPTHYRIDQEIFEAAWNIFESGNMQDPERAKLLMRILIDNNIGEEKTNINAEAGL